MTKKSNSAKNAVETILKKAQKQADELIASAKNAADSARKSAKKARKAANKANRSAAPSGGDAGGSSAPAEQTPPATEQSSAAEALPLPTVDEPDRPSAAWTVARLRGAAREHGVTGYGSMRKDQLIAALTDRP